MFNENINEINRQSWLKKTLSALEPKARILDAGAGELKDKQDCNHLDYVSQDFCQYEGEKGGALNEGLQCSEWDTNHIDLVSDITSIPSADASFDAIICSEVLEHVPEPTQALNEFSRLLKPGGKLIITAPFASIVHMAPYYYCSGFSSYWYKYHLESCGFNIEELSPNGDWFAYLHQEIIRLGSMERRYGNWSWIFAYAYSLLGVLYFKIRGDKRAEDLACFGWHCVAVKQ